MMETSSPNRWRYGGVLETYRWEADAGGRVRLYYGGEDDVRPGESIRVLHTGEGSVLVDVVHA